METYEQVMAEVDRQVAQAVQRTAGLMALYQHLNHEPQIRRKPLKSKEFQRQNLC